ncbi:carbon-nitrogen hydrolase family protein, partial [Spirochaetota bacterium]
NLKLAVCQLKPAYDKQKNIDKAVKMIKKASDAGANMALLPEMFVYPYEMNALMHITDTHDETISQLAACAKENNVYICSGSIPLKKGKKLTNTSFLIDRKGNTILTYSKCHLFDVSFNELKVRESAYFSPGTEVQSASTEYGRIGIAICYDIRFPELIRKLTLQGIHILLVPAAFSILTGRAHWHTTFRCRAAENQIFIAAASPARNTASSYKAYGHSMIIGPWGDVLAEAKTGEKVIIAELNHRVLKEMRKRLPLLKQRRPDLYT